MLDARSLSIGSRYHTRAIGSLQPARDGLLTTEVAVLFALDEEQSWAVIVQKTPAPGDKGQGVAVVKLPGAAVLAGGSASVRIVPIMGACFMFVGTLALLLPGWNDLLLPVGFGGLHLIFGTAIAVKYGG